MVETNLNNNILFSQTSVKLRREKSRYKDQGVQFFLKNEPQAKFQFLLTATYYVCQMNEFYIFIPIQILVTRFYRRR